MGIKLVYENEFDADGFESWEVETQDCTCFHGCNQCSHTKKINIFWVWSHLADIVNVFMTLQTQWQISSMSGIVIGLRYEAIHATLELMDIHKQDKQRIFHGLRVMEAAALTEFKAQRDKKGK